MEGNNGFIGYNTEELKKMFEGLVNCHKDIVTAVNSDLQTRLIDRMGEFWYSGEAKEVGDAVAEVINNDFNNAIKNTFNELISYLDSVCAQWIKDTHNDKYNDFDASYAKQVEENFNVNSDNVKTSLGGQAGIDENMAADYIQSLPGLKQLVINKMSSAYSAVNNFVPFLGGNQEQAVVELLNKLKGFVEDMFAFIIDGQGNFNVDGDFRGMQGEIQSWLEIYGTRASSKATAMSTGEGSTPSVHSM